MWIPPGEYQDAWTGTTTVGPKLVVATQPLGRIPLWHRKGGLLITAPIAQTVDEQDWSELTLEIFPRAHRHKDPPQQRRVIREGEPGEGTTVFYEETTDGRLSIQILPSKSTPARAWLVRVNLEPDHALASAVVDGVLTSTDSLTVLAPVPLDQCADFFPLRGRGAAPASEAGDVVELQLASAVGKRSVSMWLR